MDPYAAAQAQPQAYPPPQDPYAGYTQQPPPYDQSHLQYDPLQQQHYAAYYPPYDQSQYPNPNPNYPDHNYPDQQQAAVVQSQPQPETEHGAIHPPGVSVAPVSADANSYYYQADPNYYYHHQQQYDPNVVAHQPQQPQWQPTEYSVASYPPPAPVSNPVSAPAPAPK